MVRKDLIHQSLCHLPQKMVNMHGTENMTEFVLHELSHKNCFNLKKAAYFIDNPDFNCIKGIAGVSQDEPCNYDSCVWEDPQKFTNHMLSSPFNARVRCCSLESLKNKDCSQDQIVQILAKDLGIERPRICCIDMKHDNHGFFVYEPFDDQSIDEQDLRNGLSLFAFCPIF